MNIYEISLDDSSTPDAGEMVTFIVLLCWETLRCIEVDQCVHYPK